MYRNSNKSFTLIEVVVVMAVMGLIMGGLLVSLRQIIDTETLLKNMQKVEEESRFIMEVFTQDAEYSDLGADYKIACENDGDQDVPLTSIGFLLTEKKSQIGSGSASESIYSSQSGPPADKYYLIKSINNYSDPPVPPTTLTLNNTPLGAQPVFKVKMIKTQSGAENFFITLSLVFRVETRNQEQPVLVPIQTSAMSRTFEF